MIPNRPTKEHKKVSVHPVLHGQRLPSQTLRHNQEETCGTAETELQRQSQHAGVGMPLLPHSLEGNLSDPNQRK